MKNHLLLLFALLLCGASSAQAPSKAQGLKPYPWLESLSIQEQRAAITFYMIALNEKSNTLLSNSKSKSDELWALKVNACGTLFGAQIATKNIDQHEALKNKAYLLIDVIQGKRGDESQKRLKSVQEAEYRVAESTSEAAVRSLKANHAKQMDELNSRMIVAAMACASEK